LFAAIWLACTAHAADLSREQALKALERPDAAARLAGVERLAEIGQMADADRLLGRLGDADPQVRESAAQAMWQIWGRSGDPAIDTLFARGVEQMQRAAYEQALTVFNEIVARKPEFAEGWNKRATVYFLLGQNQESLRDCDEVLKRNPNHFGALSGAGQIHLKLDHPQLALDFFKRALKVNPNLDSIRQVIPILEQHLRDKGGITT
jgi:tetratricopeptide (TPR) repeat protein